MVLRAEEKDKETEEGRRKEPAEWPKGQWDSTTAVPHSHRLGYNLRDLYVDCQFK